MGIMLGKVQNLMRTYSRELKSTFEKTGILAKTGQKADLA